MAILSIGFITYNKASLKYLPYFLESLKQQTLIDFNILVIDNSDQNFLDNQKILQASELEIKIIHSGINLGFAKANNLLIDQAIKTGSKYYLTLNPDMILDYRALEEALKCVSNNSRIGSVALKTKRWDFENNIKTNYIDTCGLILKPGLVFSDLGQGEVDCQQYNEAEIIGASGCAALYNLEALQEVAVDKQYFDESMFMYKEDCDLAYRLFLAGWQCKLAPEAIIYHDRTASKNKFDLMKSLKERKCLNRQIKIWSLENQLRIWSKFWSMQSSLNKIQVLKRFFLRFIFALIFERFLIVVFLKFLKASLKIKQCKAE